jgi:hypothetical protein
VICVVGTQEVIIIYRRSLADVVNWLLIVEVEEEVVSIVLRGSSSHAGG